LRRHTGIEHRANLRRHLFGPQAQRVIEHDICAPARLTVKQRPRGHGHTQHLFETQCLSTELDPVFVSDLGPSPLVLDRERTLEPASGRSAEFDYVRPEAAKLR
jgi:hypothetical protein